MNIKSFTPLIGSLVLVVVAASAYGFAYSLVGTKSGQVATLLDQINQKTEATTRVAVAKSELIALQSQEATVDQYFVSTSDVVPFLEQLAATGKYLGANVQVLSVSSVPGTPYGQLNLSLTITGSFNSVLRTLGAIEYGPHDTQVSSVTFAAPPGSNVASPTWTANAVFVIGARTDAPANSPVQPAAVSAPVTPIFPITATTTTVSTTTTASSSSSTQPSAPIKLKAA